MKITLNKNSWHYKYYSLVISDNPPKSLCPYFWSMVSLIVFSPVFLCIFALKYTSIFFDRIIPKKKSEPKKSVLDMNSEELEEHNKKIVETLKRTELTGKILVGVFISMVAILMILALYVSSQKVGWWNVLIHIFSVIGLWSTMFWLGELLAKKWGSVTNSNYVKVPSGMVKSIYNKTCPLIDWN